MLLKSQTAKINSRKIHETLESAKVYSREIFLKNLAAKVNCQNFVVISIRKSKN